MIEWGIGVNYRPVESFSSLATAYPSKLSPLFTCSESRPLYLERHMPFLSQASPLNEYKERRVGPSKEPRKPLDFSLEGLDLYGPRESSILLHYSRK